MFGPGMIRALNQAATVKGLWDKLDEIAPCEAGEMICEAETEFLMDQLAELPEWVTDRDDVRDVVYDSARDWFFGGDLYDWPDEVLESLIEDMQQALRDHGQDPDDEEEEG